MGDLTLESENCGLLYGAIPIEGLFSNKFSDRGRKTWEFIVENLCFN
jgi:hypothetical protein